MEICLTRFPYKSCLQASCTQGEPSPSLLVANDLQVKPFFDDAAHDKNSCHMVNHVTVSQFKQGLGVKMGFTSLSQSDIQVLIEKFLDDEYPPGDMINYVAFAHCLNPPTHSYD